MESNSASKHSHDSSSNAIEWLENSGRKNGEKMLREIVNCRSHAIFFRHSAVLSPTPVLLSMVSINKSGVNGMQRGQLEVCVNKLGTTRLTKGIRG